MLGRGGGADAAGLSKGGVAGKGAKSVGGVAGGDGIVAHDGTRRP